MKGGREKGGEGKKKEGKRRGLSLYFLGISLR